MMFSDFPLSQTQVFGATARRMGLQTFVALSHYVRALPYGRIQGAGGPKRVLLQGRGTCGSKHCLLAASAREVGREEVELMVGIYLMNEWNTPGVGAHLGRESIPEAHCYLRIAGTRVDFTGLPAGEASPFDSLLRELTVEPELLSATKHALHVAALAEWAPSVALHPGEAWELRERCIAALAAHKSQERSRDR